MTVRKKRVLSMVAGVAVCGIIAVVLLMIAQNRDEDEYKKRQRSFEGVWTDEDDTFALTVWRLTSAHMVVTLENKKYGHSLPYISAETALGDRYEFTYDIRERAISGAYNFGYGKDAAGTIELMDSSIKVDIPTFGGMKKGLEYHGILKNKKSLKKENVIHLKEYMGTKERVPDELKNCCSFERDEDGTVRRVHIVWEKDPEAYYNCELGGIGKVCFEGDCAAAFGGEESAEAMDRDRRRLVYRDDTYQYTFMMSPYGMAVEGDCQYLNLPDERREGDFVMKGDTVVRYLGDYEKERVVELPEGTKKIAKNAFHAEEYSYNADYVKPIRLSIPPGVEIEADAFAGCSRMSIELEEGREEITEGAFAHMVPLEKKIVRAGWVSVNLPKTMRKLGDMAFGLSDDEYGLPAYWGDPDERESPMSFIQPVTVRGTNFLTYIGDNALWGIMIQTLPSGLEYMGKNITTTQREIALPPKLRVLKKHSIYLFNDYLIAMEIPTALEEMENDVFVNEDIIVENYVVAEKNEHFWKNECDWLFSRDKKILYGSNGIREPGYMGANGVKKALKKYYRKVRKGKRTEYVRIVPEGVEEVRNGAMADEFSSSICMPRTLCRLDRNCFWEPTYSCSVYIPGDVPEFTGRIENKNADRVMAVIYVKKDKREAFLKKLMEGQDDLTQEQKKMIRRHVRTYDHL